MGFQASALVPTVNLSALLASDSLLAIRNGALATVSVQALLNMISPAQQISADFPALRAAYTAGRGLVSIIGDSTSMGWGAGTNSSSGMPCIGSAVATSARYLRDALVAAGLPTILGAIGFGDRNTNAFGVTMAESGQFYSPAVTFGDGWAYQDAKSPWGRYLPHSQDGVTGAASPAAAQPGIAFDRIELFYTKNPGLGSIDVLVDGALLQTLSEDDSTLRLGKQTLNCAQTSGTFSLRRNSGNIFAIAARTWLSTAGPQLQIEPLGVSGWTAHDWNAADNPYSPLPAMDVIGSHLAIINLGLNDKNQGRAVADFKADLKALAARCHGAGMDVLLTIPHHASSTSSGYYMTQDWADAITQAATELALPAPVDLRSIGLLPADYVDEPHLKASGYAKVGNAYSVRLLSA